MKWGKYTPFLLLIPTFLIIILFIYWPTISSFMLSFYKVSPFGDRKIFVGFDNFINLFKSQAYLNSIKVTIIYVVITVFSVIFFGYLIALLLDNKVFGVKFYRTLIFTPYAISFTIAGALWTFMLNPVAGHINYFLDRFFWDKRQLAYWSTIRIDFYNDYKYLENASFFHYILSSRSPIYTRRSHRKCNY